MAPPDETHLAAAEGEIHTFGPLITGCRFAVVQEESQSRVLYVYDGDYDNPQEQHPLNVARIQATHSRFPKTFYRQPCLGHTLPLHFHESIFQWIPAISVDQAIIAAAIRFNTANTDAIRLPPHKIKIMPATMQRIWDQRLSSAISSDSLPKTLYPSQTTTNEGRPLLHEDRASWFAEQLGFALVIVEMDVNSVWELFESDSHSVRTRFAMCKNSEMLRPLYVGYGLGRWFTLQPRDDQWFQIFSPKR